MKVGFIVVDMVIACTYKTMFFKLFPHKVIHRNLCYFYDVGIWNDILLDILLIIFNFQFDASMSVSGICQFFHDKAVKDTRHGELVIALLIVLKLEIVLGSSGKL